MSFVICRGSLWGRRPRRVPPRLHPSRHDGGHQRPFPPTRTAATGPHEPCHRHVTRRREGGLRGEGVLCERRKASKAASSHPAARDSLSRLVLERPVASQNLSSSFPALEEKAVGEKKLNTFTVPKWLPEKLCLHRSQEGWVCGVWCAASICMAFKWLSCFCYLIIQMKCLAERKNNPGNDLLCVILLFGFCPDMSIYSVWKTDNCKIPRDQTPVKLSRDFVML